MDASGRAGRLFARGEDLPAGIAVANMAHRWAAVAAQLADVRCRRELGMQLRLRLLTG